MAIKAEDFQKLWQLLRQSTNVEEIEQYIKQIDEFGHVDELTKLDFHNLRNEAFRKLQGLTEDDSTKSEYFIFMYLLPLCIEQPVDVPQDEKHNYSRYRDRLADWIDQYPEFDRSVLRNKVLNMLQTRLTSNDPIGACWTIARIGYRQIEIVDNLWNLADQYSDEIGDIALSVLTGLGCVPGDRERLVTALHERVPLRCNVPLVRALSRLADQRSIELVTNHWLRPSEIELEMWHRTISLRILVDVADQYDMDPDLQNRVWKIISDLFLEFPDIYSSDIYLGGDIAPRCNSENIPTAMLEWISNNMEDSDQEAHRRYLLYLRLEHCVRPRQLDGWKKVRQPESLDRIKQDAIQDTQHEGNFTSKEMMRKEMAWKTLLRLGTNEMFSCFEESVATETNPFMRKKINELIACFRLDPLPSIVNKWVIDPYDLPKDKSSGEFASRMAAVQITRSAASKEAFEALLNFGVTHDGNVLQQSVDALAEVAISLASSGDTSISERLVECAVNSKVDRQRRAATGALEYLAAANLLSDKYVQQLEEIIFDDGRDPFERSVAVIVIGYIPSAELSQRLSKQLFIWALKHDDWLGGRSLESLARKGLLEKHTDLLVSRLSLQKVGEMWGLSSQESRFKWASYIIGLLFKQNPTKFTPAVASLLQIRSWRSAIQVVGLLEEMYAVSNPQPIPKIIRNALLERVRNKQTPYFAEVEIFNVLSNIMPDDLAQEPWEKTWDDWLPDARAALADSLGSAGYESSDSRKKAISHLLSLTRDGKYGVRRSAYRGLARLSPSTLQVFCEDLSQSKAVELRQRAAEAASWLKQNGSEQDMFDRVCRRLFTDQDGFVREEMVNAQRDRRDRYWADIYISQVRKVEGKTNEETLDAWRYGDALIQIGDDNHIHIIQGDLGNRKLPQNVRHWLKLIHKGIKERWRKVTQKWPEPWLPWRGSVMYGHGNLILSNEQKLQVNYSLWEQPAHTPSQKHSWGGAVWPTNIFTTRSDEFLLQLENGSQVKILIKEISGQMLTFNGTGSFPA